MFFDDFSPGQRFQTASRTVTEADILKFAHEWDPQSFHIDPEAAGNSIFGGLIASGFHTLLIAFNLVLEANIWTEASQGAPGVDNLRWIKPVRPGDTLSVEMEVVETRPSTSRTDRGYVTFDYVVSRQGGEVVASWRSTLITLRAPSR